MYGCFGPCVIYGFGELGEGRVALLDERFAGTVEIFTDEVVKLHACGAFYGVCAAWDHDGGWAAVGDFEKAAVEELYASYTAYRVRRGCRDAPPAGADLGLGFHVVLRGDYETTVTAYALDDDAGASGSGDPSRGTRSEEASPPPPVQAPGEAQASATL